MDIGALNMVMLVVILMVFLVDLITLFAQQMTTTELAVELTSLIFGEIMELSNLKEAWCCPDLPALERLESALIPILAFQKEDTLLTDSALNMGPTFSAVPGMDLFTNIQAAISSAEITQVIRLTWNLEMGVVFILLHRY